MPVPAALERGLDLRTTLRMSSYGVVFALLAVFCAVGMAQLAGRGELRVDGEHLVVVHELLFGLVVGVARRGLDAVHAQGLFDLAPQLEVLLLVRIVIFVLILVPGCRG